MIELILAVQILLVAHVDCGKEFAYGCFSAYDNGDREIQILETLPEWEKYWVLYHEQGHNLMTDRYKVPSMYTGEENRSNMFAYWMMGKKFGKLYMYPGSADDLYFLSICPQGCINILLEIDLLIE